MSRRGLQESIGEGCFRTLPAPNPDNVRVLDDSDGNDIERPPQAGAHRFMEPGARRALCERLEREAPGHAVDRMILGNLGILPMAA